MLIFDQSLIGEVVPLAADSTVEGSTGIINEIHRR